MHHDINLGDLRLFCSIARHASFVGAATELGYSSAHVSKRIAALEKQLEVKLFDRTTRQVQLSDAGLAILEWAQHIVESSRGLADAIADSRNGNNGDIHLLTSPVLGRRHIGPILHAFKLLNPGARIWLDLTHQPARDVDAKYDIDIRIAPPTENHLVAQHLWRSERILCAAPDYLRRHGLPQRLEELADHECLGYRDREQTFEVWRLSGPDGTHNVRFRSSMGSNSAAIALDWVQAGLGILLIGRWDVAAELASGELVQVLPEYSQEANIWAVCTRNGMRSSRIRACLQFIREQLQAGPYALSELPPEDPEGLRKNVR